MSNRLLTTDEMLNGSGFLKLENAIAEIEKPEHQQIAFTFLVDEIGPTWWDEIETPQSYECFKFYVEMKKKFGDNFFKVSGLKNLACIKNMDIAFYCPIFSFEDNRIFCETGLREELTPNFLKKVFVDWFLNEVNAKTGDKIKSFSKLYFKEVAEYLFFVPFRDIPMILWLVRQNWVGILDDGYPYKHASNILKNRVINFLQKSANGFYKKPYDHLPFYDELYEILDSFVDFDFLDGLTMDELRNKCFLDFVD